MGRVVCCRASQLSMNSIATTNIIVALSDQTPGPNVYHLAPLDYTRRKYIFAPLCMWGSQRWQGPFTLCEFARHHVSHTMKLLTDHVPYPVTGPAGTAGTKSILRTDPNQHGFGFAINRLATLPTSIMTRDKTDNRVSMCMYG